MPLKNWCSIHAWCSKSCLRHCIRFCGSFSSLKQNFIAYRSSKVSDCIFEIHLLWQSGFSWVYSNCSCSCWFEPESIKIGQLSHKMYSNNILNSQESTTILNAHTKKVGKIIACSSYIYISISKFYAVKFASRKYMEIRSWKFTSKVRIISFFKNVIIINLVGKQNKRWKTLMNKNGLWKSLYEK